MKKIITLIVTVFMCAVTLVGCCSESNSETSARFIVIDDNIPIECPSSEVSIENTYFFADRETGVIYLFVDGFRTSSMTALLNTDGTPMIYDFETGKIIQNT